ncbi:MAG TPA: YceI family protein, partial [Caldithrix sp.]|nr:YceI family protein [Caldithrix sp.]
MKRILSVLFIFCTFIFAEEYHVDKSAKNEVKFISDAPIEDFEGVTGQIDGYLYFKDGDFTKKSQLYFEVDLNSLDTGIGLRNRHMRENYLHTDKYPATYYKGKIIKSDTLAETQVKATTDGVIFIHGVEQPLNVEAILIRDGKQINIQCQFEVKLTDFDIEIPSIM